MGQQPSAGDQRPRLLAASGVDQHLGSDPRLQRQHSAGDVGALIQLERPPGMTERAQPGDPPLPLDDLRPARSGLLRQRTEIAERVVGDVRERVDRRAGEGRAVGCAVHVHQHACRVAGEIGRRPGAAAASTARTSSGRTSLMYAQVIVHTAASETAARRSRSPSAASWSAIRTTAQVLLGDREQQFGDRQRRGAEWRDGRWVSTVFYSAYQQAAGKAPFLPASEADLQMMMDAFLLRKAVYELGYELNNRPDWVKIPVEGILELVDQNNPP